MTSDRNRTVKLREERTGPDRRFLSAYLTQEGALRIEGQDLGPATALVHADGEYEWFKTIRPEHLPRLVGLLGGEPGADVLDLLAERYTGDGAAEFERILRESASQLSFSSGNGPASDPIDPDGAPGCRRRRVVILALTESATPSYASCSAARRASAFVARTVAPLQR